MTELDPRTAGQESVLVIFLAVLVGTLPTVFQFTVVVGDPVLGQYGGVTMSVSELLLIALVVGVVLGWALPDRTDAVSIAAVGSFVGIVLTAILIFVGLALFDDGTRLGELTTAVVRGGLSLVVQALGGAVMAGVAAFEAARLRAAVLSADRTRQEGTGDASESVDAEGE